MGRGHNPVARVWWPTASAAPAQTAAGAALVWIGCYILFIMCDIILPSAPIITIMGSIIRVVC